MSKWLTTTVPPPCTFAFGCCFLGWCLVGDDTGLPLPEATTVLGGVFGLAFLGGVFVEGLLLDQDNCFVGGVGVGLPRTVFLGGVVGKVAASLHGFFGKDDGAPSRFRGEKLDFLGGGGL